MSKSHVQNKIVFITFRTKCSQTNNNRYHIHNLFQQFSMKHCYTLSQLENDLNVSAYSGGRRLSSRAQLVCFLTRSKRNTGIDLQCVFLDAISDVTVVLGMWPSIVDHDHWHTTEEDNRCVVKPYWMNNCKFSFPLKVTSMKNIS